MKVYAPMKPGKPAPKMCKKCGKGKCSCGAGKGKKPC
jgi:hypothetical protein